MNVTNYIEYHGKRPFWKTILATILFTAAFMCIYAIYNKYKDAGETIDPSFIFVLLIVGIWCGIFGAYYATIYNYFVDLKNRKYKILGRIGPIRWGKWKDLIDVKSLSIAKINPEEYEIELLFYGKKKRLILAFADYEEAMEFASNAAVLLEIELIDLIS